MFRAAGQEGPDVLHRHAKPGLERLGSHARAVRRQDDVGQRGQRVSWGKRLGAEDVQACADGLGQLALDAGAKDNVSCVVIDVVEAR